MQGAGTHAAPGYPQTLASYTTYLAQGRRLAPASVKQAVQAIKSVHGVAGHSLSSTWAAKVTRAHTRQWAQEGNREKQASALSLEELRALLEVTQGRAGLRDSALLLGITGMFRRSELTSLLIQDLCITEKGLEMYLAVSKTD